MMTATINLISRSLHKPIRIEEPTSQRGPRVDSVSPCLAIDFVFNMTKLASVVFDIVVNDE